KATSHGISGVGVGIPRAEATSRPAVSSYIANQAIVTATGSVTVQTLAGTQATAIAAGGSGAGFGVSFPTASATTQPDARAYVAARTLNAGGNVGISSVVVVNMAATADT